MVRKSTYLFIALISLGSLGAANRAARLVKEGNQLFDEEKYDQALSKYNEAQQELPDSPRIYFNLGDVYYRQSEYGKADSLFSKTKESKDLQLKADAFYNQGNARYREGKLKEALAAYKKSIEMNARDMDAKFNYELTRLKLEEEEQKKKEQKEQKEQKEESEDKKEEKEQKEEEPRPSPVEEEPQEQQPKEQQEKEMSQEDVERLLDSLLSEEEDQREIMMRREKGETPEVSKDW